MFWGARPPTAQAYCGARCTTWTAFPSYVVARYHGGSGARLRLGFYHIWRRFSRLATTTWGCDALLLDATMATGPAWAPGVLCTGPARHLQLWCGSCQCMDVASNVAHCVDGGWYAEATISTGPSGLLGPFNNMSGCRRGGGRMHHITAPGFVITPHLFLLSSHLLSAVFCMRCPTNRISHKSHILQHRLVPTCCSLL